jgi:hypothetical protein
MADPAGDASRRTLVRMRRMSGHRIRWATAAIASVLLVGVAAPARAASVDDPDFARGPLDLKRLVATKHDATAPLHLRLITYGKWRASLLDVSGDSRLYFLFNGDDSGPVDLVGEVFFRDGRLLMRITTGDGQFVRRVQVDHPRRDRVTAIVPRGLPNPDGNAWIAAKERYRSATGFCASICHDRIPNEGWLQVTPGL